jgi:TIR domain
MENETFISYTQPDKIIAFNIHDLLQKNSIKSWIDKSADGIVSGKYYGEQIVTAIKNCKLFILVHSDYANKSTEVIKEVRNADGKEIHIFKVDNSAYSDSLDYNLKGLQYINASGNHLKEAYQILLHNIKMSLENYRQTKAISTDKILLNNGLKLLEQKNYQNAELVLEQYISIAYEDIDGKFYLAIAIAEGRKPRKLDGMVVKRIEALLMPCISQRDYGHINALLAFIRWGYYAMNGFIEPQPNADKLLNNLMLNKEKVEEILFHFYDPDNEVWGLLNDFNKS